MRKTKIICTLGPAVDSVEKLKDLIVSGMDCARLNFSHGSFSSHREMIRKFKEARELLNVQIPIMLDTKGPEIRINKFINDKIVLHEEDIYVLDTNEELGDISRIGTNYPDLYKYVKVGNKLLLDDGKVTLEVIAIKDKDIICKVIHGGVLSNNKSIAIPNLSIPMKYISKKDEEDILFGIKEKIDYIAISFTRSKEDVLAIRKLLDENDGEKIKIISKIENYEGIEHLDDIIDVSDGIMVARGDLGVETSFKEIPKLQKDIIAKCNKKGKIVVTATQMLESMITSNVPTRAEVSDVANAVYDKTSAVMLSGETAMGNYPIEACKIMSEIVEEIDESLEYKIDLRNNGTLLDKNILNATCLAACTSATYLNAKAIVVVTYSSNTANLISDFRPGCPIIAAVVDEVGLRQANLRWGVTPYKADVKKSTEELVKLAKHIALRSNLVKENENIIIVLGTDLGKEKENNEIIVCKL